MVAGIVTKSFSKIPLRAKIKDSGYHPNNKVMHRGFLLGPKFFFMQKILYMKN